MTNDQNIVRGRHIDSLAADAKRFTLEQNLALNQAIQAELAELDTGTSYDVFTGATSNTGGLSGLVPAPQAGDESKFLRGDGTWSGELILPTVSSSVNGGFWLDVSGAPPAPKFYYGGTTYTFDVTVPSYEGYKIAEIRRLVTGGFITDYRYQEGDEPLTAHTITAEQCSQVAMFLVQIDGYGFEIPTLTSSMVTIAGYIPIAIQDSNGAQTCEMKQDSQKNLVLTITLTATKRDYTTGTGNQLTVTINDGVHTATTIEITWAVASNELKQQAIVNEL